jgi:hypothetical protein
LKIATECHSVRSRFSPVSRSFQFSEVAIRRLQTLPPFWNVRTSGSRPRLPIRITLFTLPAMAGTSLLAILFVARTLAAHPATGQMCG